MIPHVVAGATLAEAWAFVHRTLMKSAVGNEYVSVAVPKPAQLPPHLTEGNAAVPRIIKVPAALVLQVLERFQLMGSIVVHPAAHEGAAAPCPDRYRPSPPTPPA